MFQRSIYCEAQKEMFAILLDIWYDGFLLNMQTVFKNHIINVNNGHMQVHLVYINTFFLFPKYAACSSSLPSKCYVHL